MFDNEWIHEQSLCVLIALAHSIFVYMAIYIFIQQEYCVGARNIVMTAVYFCQWIGEWWGAKLYY